MQLRSMSFVMTIVLFTFAAFASPEKSAPAPDSADDRIIQTMSAGAHRGLTLYDCADGDVHDDGSAENDYGWPDTVTDGRYVEKFTPASYPFKYSDVCVCLSQTEKFVGFYSVVMYDDNGPGGSPGDEIFRLVTSTDFFDVFHSMPIEAHCPAIESGSVYFGVQWDADSALHTFVCADESATTPISGGYAYDNFVGWRPIQNIHPNYRAMLIRAKGQPFSDCNNNGVDDSREVTDGIPYSVDDGRAELMEACCTDLDMLRMNQFVVQKGGEVIDRIAIAWGDQLEGTPVTVHIFDDPDNDPSNSPTNHILLASAKATVQNPLTDIFNEIPIGPVYVGEAGDSFSVAFLIENVGFGFPTYLDVHNVQFRSWTILWPGGTADVNDLSTGFNPSLEDEYNYTIRAIAVPVDCNNNAAPDDCDTATGGASEDCNENTIPDECEVVRDLFTGDFTTCEGAFVLNWPGNLFASMGGTLPFDFHQCGNQFSIYALWGLYRPASTGTAFFGFTSQSGPMMVNVFDGCPNAGGVQIACNHPNPNGATFDVQRGKIYYLRYGPAGLTPLPASLTAQLVGPRNLVSANDFNDNDVPDECDCLFDVNNDNVVDMMDFLDARANLGMCLSMPCLGDVDNDGDVDNNDLQLILLNVGPCQFPRAAIVGESPRPARK